MVKYGDITIVNSRVVKQKFIEREDLRAQPEVTFLFGDNCKRIGLGGQAKEMRGEPNAVGIRTKKSPEHSGKALFTQEDWDNDREIIMEMIDEDFARIPKNSLVVVPTDGLGTGFAKLDTNCPDMLKYIENKILKLSFDR